MYLNSYVLKISFKISGFQIGRQQQLRVPLVPLETCERIFGESVPINESQLCAGGEEGKDACSGFGGAPLIMSKDGQYYQVNKHKLVCLIYKL